MSAKLVMVFNIFTNFLKACAIFPKISSLLLHEGTIVTTWLSLDAAVFCLCVSLFSPFAFGIVPSAFGIPASGGFPVSAIILLWLTWDPGSALNGLNPLVPVFHPFGWTIVAPEKRAPITTGCCPSSPSAKNPMTVSDPLGLKLTPVPPSPTPIFNGINTWAQGRSSSLTILAASGWCPIILTFTL